MTRRAKTSKTRELSCRLEVLNRGGPAPSCVRRDTTWGRENFSMFKRNIVHMFMIKTFKISVLFNRSLMLKGSTPVVSGRGLVGLNSSQSKLCFFRRPSLYVRRSPGLTQFNHWHQIRLTQLDCVHGSTHYRHLSEFGSNVA